MSCQNCDCARCRAVNAQPAPVVIRIPAATCSCPKNGWWSVAPPPVCPFHGQVLPLVTISTDSTGAVS